MKRNITDKIILLFTTIIVMAPELAIATDSTTSEQSMNLQCPSLKGITDNKIDNRKKNDWTYETQGDSYLITGYNGSKTDLVIPNTINGKPVVFNPSFFNPRIGKQNITSLSFSTAWGKNVKFVNKGSWNLSFSEYTNLKNFDGRGLEISGIITGTSNIASAFRGLKNLQSVDISNWNSLTDISYLFADCTNLVDVKMPQNTSNIQLMDHLFTNCGKLSTVDTSSWNTENVTDMASMFENCSSLTQLDVSKWNTGQVTSMERMFSGCNRLKNLNTSGWHTPKVKYMAFIFQNCSSLSQLDVSSWNTANVVDMESMFENCSSLTQLDVSKWNTGQVTSMERMFSGCNRLKNLNTSGWHTPKVKYMAFIFQNCSSLSQLDVSSWNTANVVDMESMFENCSSLTQLDVSNWNTSQVTSMERMFAGCDQIKFLDASSWNTTKVQYMGFMFSTTKETPLIIITDDKKLTKFYYASNNRIPGGPVFDANGGTFNDDSSTKNYFDSCTISPKNPRIQLETFERFKENLRPTKLNDVFTGWNLTEGNEPKNNNDLGQVIKYTANWTKSLENGNIPSQNIDNVKPSISSIYGIAYMPRSISFPKTELAMEGSQIIPNQTSNDYHIAVRDQRMVRKGWTLQAQLLWDTKELKGSYIQLTNNTGEVKKNINDGSKSFQSSDLINNDGTVSGEKNIKIGSTLTTIMTGNSSAHNGVYDYNLGKLSLVLENVKNIAPGNYTGNIHWNLISAP